MTPYREKGTVVEAVQWYPNPVSATEDANPFIVVITTNGYDPSTGEPASVVNYRFRPGYSESRIAPGDWIVESDIEGTYVYNDETFRALYDPMEEE